MNLKSESVRKIRFKIGVALIVVSYAFLGSTFVFGALALSSAKYLWKCAAFGSFILNWVIFIIGLLLAGPEAVGSASRWFFQFFRRKNDSRLKTSPVLTPKSAPEDLK